MWTLARRSVQLTAVLVLLSPLAGFTFFLGTYAASFVLSLLHLADPYAALQTGLLPLAVAALPIVLANWLLGRLFCGWICPLGLLLEGVDKLRGVLRVRDRKVAPWLRWVLAAGLLAGSLLAGYPLFERFGPQQNLYRSLLFGITWEALVLAAVILADLLIARRLWCRTLCPAGVTYGLLANTGILRIGIDQANCDHCGTCLKECPMGQTTLFDAVARKNEGWADPATCTACGECIQKCPNSNIAFRWDFAPDPARRKALLAIGGTTLMMALGRPALVAMGAPSALPRPRAALRPPGALHEEEYLATCVRCGTCALICPRQAIQVDHGLPYIDARTQACDLCRKCPDACPSGALTLAPGEPVQMGTAELDRTKCLSWGHGILCRACFVSCPLQETAITLDQSTGVWKPVVHLDLCAGCGMCEYVCPQESITVRFDLVVCRIPQERR